MKVTLHRIKAPQMPSDDKLRKFASTLFPDNEQKSLCMLMCLAITLAIAPDDERNMESVIFYLSELAKKDGICDMTLSALEMWLTGTIPQKSDNQAFEQILTCFRGAYLFGWQKRLIKLALDTRNELVCYDDFRDYALEAENEIPKSEDAERTLSRLLCR